MSAIFLGTILGVFVSQVAVYLFMLSIPTGVAFFVLTLCSFWVKKLGYMIISETECIFVSKDRMQRFPLASIRFRLNVEIEDFTALRKQPQKLLKRISNWGNYAIIRRGVEEQEETLEFRPTEQFLQADSVLAEAQENVSLLQTKTSVLFRRLMSFFVRGYYDERD